MKPSAPLKFKGLWIEESQIDSCLHSLLRINQHLATNNTDIIFSSMKRENEEANCERSHITEIQSFNRTDKIL